MSFIQYQIQKYNAAKMNDPRFPHIAVEVPVSEKTHKYKRYAHEKRAKRTPGVKRVQTPHIMVTKWDVEIANKRNKKMERARDRKDKYGDWSENQTDTEWEDHINGKERVRVEKLLHSCAEQKRLEREQQCIRRALADYAALLFPSYNLSNRDGWPTWAWECYHEQKDLEEEQRAYKEAWRAILNSPEQLAINSANADVFDWDDIE